MSERAYVPSPPVAGYEPHYCGSATPEQWEQLRRPFEAHEINKLPKGKGSGDLIQCDICGTRHYSRGIFHVDYVGHARVTERLNEVDPGWTMVPGAMQFPDEELVFMPVAMTIFGVTHHEVGCASQDDDEWPKQVYSDAITRAAMRFGVGLDLWKKEVTTRRSRPAERPPAPRPRRVDPNLEALLAVVREDVAHLDLTGMAAWGDWKAAHPGWWKSVDVLVEARDFVMDLLAAGETEPWPENDQSPGSAGIDGDAGTESEAERLAGTEEGVLDGTEPF